MSVGPTRGPVQRAGIDRDLTEIFARLDILERVKPGQPDYIFVEAKNEDRGGLGLTDIDFLDIPQDARHLEIFGIGYGPMNIQFNGDTDDHYRDLSHRIEDVGGVTADTVAASAGYVNAITVRGIDDSAGSAGDFPYRFRIVIPYYAIWPNASTPHADRSCEIDAWQLHVEPVEVVDQVRIVKTAGWWDIGGADSPQNAVPPTAITRVSIFGSTGFAASLYKIL